MAKKWWRLVRMIPLALLFAGTALAQNTSSITGTVTDGSTGKPVIGAVIVVTSPALQGEQTVVSEAGGKYSVPNLPAGEYTLAVQMDGYKPFERSDLKLKEGTTLRANAQVVPEAVQMEEVVVTGSRIRRKDLTTPAPVAIINSEQIQASGKVTVGDFLQSLPEQGNTVNTQVGNGNDGSVNISLRSLGENRTLVLVNGRRMVAGGVSPGVAPDLNTIPAAAVERVEILKDGASAVYGSDAIAGVVNIILKKKFEGVLASAYAGTSSRGDGTNYDTSVTTGTSGEKGNALFSVGYQEQQKALAGDRHWAETAYNYDWGTGKRIAAGNSSTFPETRFKVNGTNYIMDGDTPVEYTGALYNTNPTNTLLNPNRRIQVFSTGDYKLGDSARLFYEASYVNRYSHYDMAPMPVVSNSIPTNVISISADSMYNPYGVDISSWRKRMVDFGNRQYTQDLDTFRVVVGLDGTLADWAGPLSGWTWDVSYNHGRTQGIERTTGLLVMSRVGQSLGASEVVDGKARCLDAGGNVIAGCVPMNVFGSGDSLVSDGNTITDLKNWLTFTGESRAYSQQQVLSANTAGELFKLWADRPLGLALGADYRRESGAFEPDPITASSDSSGNNQVATGGSYDVKEVYAELSVPLLGNLPLVQDLELDLAGRFVDYSSFGNNASYKVGLRYTPVRDVTLRGTYSTAYRAPNINELYLGATDSYEYASDPKGKDANTQFLTKWLGNKDLKPEKANTFTVGMVLEPRWVRDLAFTLDYYDIRVRDSIERSGTQFILNRCAEAKYSPDNAYCQVIHRDSDEQITYIEDKLLNQGKTETNGLDLAAHYLQPSPVGRFGMSLEGTYLLRYDTTDPSGSKVKHAGNYDDLLAMPRFKANASVTYMPSFLEGLSGTVVARYVHSYRECASQECSVDSTYERRISYYLPFDAVATYDFGTQAGKTSLTIGVNNVFDTTPPYISTAGNFNSDPSTYDYVGRYYYTRLTHKF